MELDREIQLGNGLPSVRGDSEREQKSARAALQKSANARILLLGMVVSILLHAALVLALLRSKTTEVNEPIPTTVQIQFTPSNPLRVTLAPEIEEPDSVEEVLEEESRAEAPANDVQQDAAELARSAAAQAERQPLEQEPLQANEMLEPENSLSTRQNPLVELAPMPVPPAPTTLEIQRSIEVIQTDQASRFYAYNCNVLDRKQGLRDCESIDERDYSMLEQSAIYDFHNPVVEQSRTLESLTTIARETENIAAALALSNLPPGLTAYVLEEIEAGIEVYSNNGNRALQHMNTMTDTSAAAVQARRVFDPWVQQQTAVLRGRKIYNKQELDQRSRCGDIVMALLTLPPAEFAKCWLLDDKPALLFNLLQL